MSVSIHKENYDMKKIILVVFIVLAICFCSCAESKPSDTVTFAHFDDEETEATSPAETKQSELPATEPTESESAQTETEKQPETETEVTVDPGDVHFVGFTPFEESVAPVDMNGLDLSAFAEDSAEYAVYSDVGRLAVISRELGIYDLYAEAMIAQKDEIYKENLSDAEYRLKLVESSFAQGRKTKSALSALIAAFNVSEYAGEDDITEKYSIEYDETKALLKEQSVKDLSVLRFLQSWRSWQIDMIYKELQSAASICERLEARKTEGVSYGGYIDHLIKTAKTASEELFGVLDEYYRRMDGIDYPFPYKIERALYFDHVDVFIYPDENTEVKTAHDIYGGYSSIDDVIYCRYNKDKARYEITYDFCFSGSYKELFEFVNKETGAYRCYYAKTLNYLQNMTDVGEINEREFIKNMNPVLKAAYTEAYGENFALESGESLTELHFTADKDDTGIIRIELIGSMRPDRSYNYIADVTFDEPMPPLSMEELIFAVNNLRNKEMNRDTKERSYVQTTVWIDKGTVDVDLVNYPDIGEKVVLHLYGFQKELREGGGGYVPDSYFLWYYHNKSNNTQGFNLGYIDYDGRYKTDGMKFDINYKLINSQ